MNYLVFSAFCPLVTVCNFAYEAIALSATALSSFGALATTGGGHLLTGCECLPGHLYISLCYLPTHPALTVNQYTNNGAVMVSMHAARENLQALVEHSSAVVTDRSVAPSGSLLPATTTFWIADVPFAQKMPTPIIRLVIHLSLNEG